MDYPASTLRRAQRAMVCSPFQKVLFEVMCDRSISLQTIAGAPGVQHRYTDRELPEPRVESALLWLIQVGVLRREVDGQGLTDSFRLTPLGRQLVAQPASALEGTEPSRIDWLRDTWSRWLRGRL
ncbi:hypothetical protein GS597_18165 [Synechococcales cyanobacterium C]|uniref:Uncharacterized protein n=1 Tax=Petrachloros mirabilis ULC683 TaxID=2781853 RepID=A0A8K2A221_9CYAN|nr:Npun_F0494 family protein [Petrachloros mirabilis]NCJ08397.1 hypothetical protein [Petrachloros mirabilis ULC683]